MQSKDFQPLRECPFCGGEAAVRDIKEPSVNGWVGCQRCRCFMDFVKNGKPQAIAAWNRRANLGSCENVRCENCKHYNRMGCSDGFGWCERMDRGTNDDFYCSLAERNEE